MSITMSTGVPAWFIDKFKGDLYHECQQTQSLFERAVDVQPIMGAEDKAFDMIGSMEMQEKEGRNPETPRNSLSSQRRWCFHTPYHNAVQLDRDDDLEMALDPAGHVMRDFRSARNRKVDDIIYAAFDATVQVGRRNNSSTSSWTNESGDTKYTDTSGGRTIPHDCSEGNCSASDTGMTAEKAELVLEYFAKNEVPEDVPIFGAISPRQRTQLFGQEQYVNADYNTSKPLATGRYLKFWAGINWIQSNKIVKGSSNDVDSDTDVYKCWFWAMDGMILGVADSITVEMSIRNDLSYAQEVYVHMNMGAIRFDPDKVLCVECT